MNNDQRFKVKQNIFNTYKETLIPLRWKEQAWPPLTVCRLCTARWMWVQDRLQTMCTTTYTYCCCTKFTPLQHECSPYLYFAHLQELTSQHTLHRCNTAYFVYIQRNLHTYSIICLLFNAYNQHTLHTFSVICIHIA